MAHQEFRCSLSNAIFPFETDLWGRTIIMPQYDQNYNYLDQIGEPVKSRGIPQAMYMHNCLPTSQGYQAIGFDTYLAAMAGAPTDFDTIFPLEYTTPAIARFLFSPSSGKNYVYDAVVGVWASVSPFPLGTVGDIETTLVTTAFVNGTTYIYYSMVGCFLYNQVTKVMDSITLTALNESLMLGICAAMGYNIAWDGINIYWSSALDPTDFTPSLVTGASSIAPQWCNGKINFCVPISNGFMIYCERNVVSAQYTGNINFPWIFQEVAGSGGVSSSEQVSFQTNKAVHYAWTTAGAQELNKSAATLIFPEATEFLAALIFEDFDETTLTLTQDYLTQQLNIKISAVTERYIVISYGINYPTFTHALIWDDSLKRWGKIKVTHRKCFEWNAPNLYGQVSYGQLASTTYGNLINTTYGSLSTSVETTEYAEKNMAFLQQDGTVLVVNMDLAQTVADGVLMVGKFEFQRNKFITHQRSDIENVKFGNAFSFYIIPTLDGKTLGTPFGPLNIAPYSLWKHPMTQRCGGMITGKNLVALFKGAFNLTTYILDFTLGGEW